MATGVVQDPHGNFRFLFELDGITRAAFREVTGVDSTIEVTEYREGGDNTTKRKLPGLTSHANLQLRWGMTDDEELYEWHRRASEGDLERKNGSIVLLDRKGQEVARWNFVRAWPTKWTGPEFKADGSDIAIEALELAHEGLKRA